MKHVALITVFLSLFAGALFADGNELNHQSLFDRDRLLDIQIEMDPDDWTAVRSQTRAMAMALRKPATPSPFTYFKADITIDGQRVESVGIRKKGFVGSLDQVYPSLKIKFDEYVDQDPVVGHGRLTLNNNKQDVTVISQAMAYKLFADAGLPAPRCNLARVSVNGKYLGIYSNVESVKKPFLRRQFGDEIGKLYEGTLADFLVDRIDDFELKIGDEENRDELRRVSEILAKDELDLVELGQHVDVAEFLRFWAVESLINAWDGYTNQQNNFFVYHSPSDSKFHFIPWGMDSTFLPQEFVRSRFESVHSVSVLANRLYHTEGMPDRYREVLSELLDTVWDEAALLEEVDRLEALLKDHVHRRQGRFAKELNQTRTFVKTRRSQLNSEIERWPMKFGKTPRRPTFTKSVGQVTGTFAANWVDKAPKTPYESGDAQIKVTLDEEAVEFSELGVYAETDDGKNIDEQTRTIVFVGKRKSNGIRIKFRVGMSEARFRTASSERPIVVQGNLEEGGFGLFGLLSTNGVRLVAGTLTLSSDVDDEETVNGSVELDVVRFQDGK